MVANAKNIQSLAMAGCLVVNPLLHHVSVAHIGILVFLYWLKFKLSKSCEPRAGFTVPRKTRLAFCLVLTNVCWLGPIP
jgi:hypothetical protein